MSFAEPGWLLLLAPVFGLLAAYLLVQRRRSSYAVRFATLPMLDKLVAKQPQWRRHLPAGLLLLAFIALAFAAAHPETDVRVAKEGATVIVVVDVSLSMEATDVAPNRLEAARESARDFIEGLPEGLNLGLVTFSGSTTVLSPPTTDHRAVADSLDSLNLGRGTAIGEAVFTSLDQITAESKDLGAGDVPAQIVLLSDGTNTVGRPITDAVKAATDAGVPVSTIAYGTADGVVDVDGTVIPVPVDEPSLAALAQDTGGQAYTAETQDELSKVYDDIGSLVGYDTVTKDISSWVIAVALLLGLIGAGFSLRWFARLP